MVFAQTTLNDKLDIISLNNIEASSIFESDITDTQISEENTEPASHKELLFIIEGEALLRTV